MVVCRSMFCILRLALMHYASEMPIFADTVASEHAKCQGSVSYIFAL